MLTRNFNMDTISSEINDIKNSNMDMFNSTRETLTKKYSAKNSVSNLMPDSPEVQKIISDLCSNSKYSKNGRDWIGNLNRDLNRESRFNLCSDGKKMLGDGDTLLSIMGKVRGGGSIDTTNIVNSFISSEMANMGFTGTVPSCITDDLFSKINGIIGLPSGLIPKLEISDLLKNKCLKDSINFGVLQVDTAMKGTMVNSMYKNGNDKMAKEYTDSMYKTDPNKTVNMLERNVSDISSDSTTKQFNLLDRYGSGSTTNLNKDNLLTNLNKDNSNSLNFSSLDKYYTSEDSVLFKNKDNLTGLADKHISSKSSNDTLTSLNKSTVLDSASMSKIVNLW